MATSSSARVDADRVPSDPDSQLVSVTPSVSHLEGDDHVRLADWVMAALAESGVRQVFFVPGGAAMHLNDAAGAQRRLNVVGTMHEQAAAIAAESYAKASGGPALCMVTAGPGGTNAVTGVAGAWVDSTPMIVISGQVKRDDLTGATGVRQRGVQEIDIISIISPVTKYAYQVTTPEHIRYHLERAIHVATHGRPGPVWLDIPLDVQAAPILPHELPAFDPSELEPSVTLEVGELDLMSQRVMALLRDARRPLIHLGAGVRLAGAETDVRAFIERLGLPTLCTWPAQGVIGDEHPLFVGRPGALAARGANFALQNADLLLCLGARLDLASTGYDPKDFGRNALKVVVDVDPAELVKLEGAIDVPVCSSVEDFADALLRTSASDRALAVDEWRARCRDWRDRYPVVQPEHRKPAERISTYHFAEVLSNLLTGSDVLAPGSSGLGIEIFLLALKLRTGQRATFNAALGAMGYGPPAALGACLGSDGRRTICVDGDGGLQLNIQEMQTIRRLDLPIKFFVLCNDGYASIRSSQRRWFGRLVGADESSGFTVPPLDAVAHSYGIPFHRLDGTQNLTEQLRSVLHTEGPVICSVPSPPDEFRGPAQISESTPDGGMRSRPVDDLAPLLSREELAANSRSSL